MLQRWYALKATRKLENTIEKTNKDITKSIRDFDNSSTNVSNEMLLHTKVMKNLTWWILGFTILNVFFFVFQILNKVFNWGLF
jgi:predicted RNA-binding protein with PIN domain